MFRKIFSSLDELEQYTEPYESGDAMAVVIVQLPDGRLEGVWQKIKTYIDKAGNEVDDMMFITEDRQALFVQDMTEEQLRSALRYMISLDYDQDSEEDTEPTQAIETPTSNKYLH